MHDVDLSSLKELNLPRIYQLGLVVRDMAQAVAFYSKFMGIKPWYRGEVGEQKTFFRREEIEMEVDMVFGYSGRLMVELIEVREGPANIYSEHLEQEGEGLHHLGVEVAGFDKYMRQVEAMGIEVIQHGYVKSKGGAMSKLAYLDTTPYCGYPIELMETRLFGVPVGKAEFWMRVGCLLGDASKYQ